MYHPAGFGEAGERSAQRSGIRFPAPRFSPHRVLGPISPFRRIAVSPIRPFAHSPTRPICAWRETALIDAAAIEGRTDLLNLIMKLLRYGPKGQEKPGLLDNDGKI